MPADNYVFDIESFTGILISNGGNVMTRTLSLVAGICLMYGGVDSLDAHAANDISQLERVTQELVLPYFLPNHEQTAPGDPKVVQVRMVIEEKLIEVGPDGATNLNLRPCARKSPPTWPSNSNACASLRLPVISCARRRLSKQARCSQPPVYSSTQPGPRTTRPGVAPVCSPSFNTCSPLTNTWIMPVAYWCGSAKVAWSWIVSGSKTTTSA